MKIKFGFNLSSLFMTIIYHINIRCLSTNVNCGGWRKTVFFISDTKVILNIYYLYKTPQLAHASKSVYYTRREATLNLMHSHYHLLNTHPQRIPKDIRVERDQKLYSPSGQMDGEMFLCKQSLMS